MTQQTPIMEQAAKAAETVAKWSDAKKEYARRVIASGSYSEGAKPPLTKSKEA